MLGSRPDELSCSETTSSRRLDTSCWNTYAPSHTHGTSLTPLQLRKQQDNCYSVTRNDVHQRVYNAVAKRSKSVKHYDFLQGRRGRVQGQSPINMNLSVKMFFLSENFCRIVVSDLATHGRLALWLERYRVARGPFRIPW